MAEGIDTFRASVETVLIVDDSATTRLILRRMLGSLGVEAVAEASSAPEGYAALRAHPVRFLLCDIEMPDCTGPDFVRMLRNSPAYQNLPILLMTGSIRAEHVVSAQAARASGFIIKPFGAEALRRRMAEVALPAARQATPSAPAAAVAAAEKVRVSRWQSRG